LVARKRLDAKAKCFLVPTDFSCGAQKPAKEALVLARSFGGRILFLHVLDLSPLYAYDSGGDMTAALSMLELMPENFESDWQCFLSSLVLEKVVWEKHTEEGRAATTIVERAAAIHADAIVMGTHGRSGLEQMLLGVAEAVARTASCPVLTVGLRRLSLDSHRWAEEITRPLVFLFYNSRSRSGE
jgi:nucleotide-binding universal stress UspA family protein